MDNLLNYLGHLTPITLFSLGLGLITVMYLARSSGHSIIKSVLRSCYQALRLTSSSLRHAAERLRSRNRNVLLQQGTEQVERDLEKEFAEISSFVQKDLGGYPKIQQQIQQQISVIQDDYQNCGEVKPALPEWVEAVEAVGKLRNEGGQGSINTSILEQIHNAANLQHKENLKYQRETTAERHKILRTLTASWRKLASTVDSTGNHLTEIITRSRRIDEHMERYVQIKAGTPDAERTLFGSVLSQFAIAALVTAIAIGGGFFNFHLIALPMSEMVGSLHRVGGIRVADIAALVIICLEVTAGIFLLESLRITRLFPLIGSMDNKMRRLIMIGAACTLIILAGTEAALAYMRDQIAGDMSALRATLSGTEAANAPTNSHSWIPLGANMILGFVLPLALTMAAIPLEYLLQTSRTLFGTLLEWCLRLVATLLRILASTCLQASKILIGLYDLIIAVPLWIETSVKNTKKTRDKEEFSTTSTTTTDWLAPSATSSPKE